MTNLQYDVGRFFRRLIRWTIIANKGRHGLAIGLGFMLPVTTYASYMHADDGEWRIKGVRVPFGCRRVKGRVGFIAYVFAHRFSAWFSK